MNQAEARRPWRALVLAVVVMLLVVIVLLVALRACGGSSAPKAASTSSASATSAAAASPSASPTSAVIAATGSVTCDTLSGQITFSPPAIHGGTSQGTEVFTLHASGCHTTGSNVTEVTEGDVTTTNQMATDSCAALRKSTSTPGSATVEWTPGSIAPSTVSFPGGYSVISHGTGGDIGFALGVTGGASVTGSFAGSDGGASSQVTVYLNQTADQFVAACNAAGNGLSSETIAGGSATLS